MKNKSKLLMTGLMVSLVMGACTVTISDDDPEPVTVETQMVGSWMLTSATISPALDLNGDGIGETTDLFLANVIQACKQDDITTHSSNFTYTKTEGATNCNPAMATETGNWGLNPTKTIITYTHGGVVNPPMTIVSITSTTMSLTTTDPLLPGYTISMNAVKQ